MRFVRLAFVAVAIATLAAPAFAEDRASTAPEKLQVEDALKKDGYSMVNDIQVDDDQFTAFAKSKDGKDMKVTLDMKSLKVLKSEPVMK